MADVRPRRVVHLDLERGLPPGGLGEPTPVLLVAWWRELLLGYEHVHRPLPEAELSTRVAALVAPSVARRLGASDAAAATAVAAPLRELDAHAGPEPGGGPAVTLAICTRDRPEALERCLRSIVAAAPAPSEVLVVDNAPGAPATRDVVAGFPGVRYIPEPRPGLSAARNAAVRHATGDVLAFVDDDVEVHPNWLAPLRRAFADDDVMAFTGLVLPAALETETQVAFETIHGGLGLGYAPARFGRGFLRATAARGMPAWKIGAGANMAIRRSAFSLVGDFDVRLGAGAAGCSEDSEFWYRVIAAGWTCRYDPDSVVFHHHRREPEELAKQIHDYTRGHVAALFVQFARHRHAGNLHRAFVALPRHFLKRTLWLAARAVAERAGLLERSRLDLSGRQMAGYARGLRYAPLALRRQPPRHKAALRPFLAANPFPRPYTLGFFYREKMRAIHRIAPDVPAAEVLEVGGGRSGLARMLYPRARITTVDIDETHRDAAPNRDPLVRFVVADATNLPFADGTFDVVTFFDVLEHISDDARAVSEALRVLRPGGFVLVSSPSHLWRFPYYRALAPICPTDADMMAEWGHVRRGYAPDDLARLFGRPAVATAGFITPVTALGHDLAWSRLPERARRALSLLVSPLTWAGYALQGAARPGTEIAASWRKPER